MTTLVWVLAGFLVLSGLVGKILFDRLFDSLVQKNGYGESLKSVFENKGDLRGITKLIEMSEGASDRIETILGWILESTLYITLWIASLVLSAVFYSLVPFAYLYGRIRGV